MEDVFVLAVEVDGCCLDVVCRVLGRRHAFKDIVGQQLFDSRRVSDIALVCIHSSYGSSKIHLSQLRVC